MTEQTPLETLKLAAQMCALTGEKPDTIEAVFREGYDEGRRSYLDHNPEERQRIIDEIKNDNP